MNNYKYNILNIVIFIVLSLYSVYNYDNYLYISHRISAISLCMLLYQLVVLIRLKFDILSFQTLFVLFSYIFIFSFFWLDSFGKGDFIFFRNWMDDAINHKYHAALFSQICIHSIFSGFVFYPIKKKSGRMDNSFLSNYALFKIGITFVLIGFPFKLYFDYLNIVNSVNAGYGNFSGTVGIVDDFQHFLVAGIIILISSKRFSKRTNIFVALLFLLYCILVMLASGDRRYYITALISIFMSLYYSNRKSTFKISFKRVLYGVISFVGVIFVLNLLAVIRYNRFSSLGLGMLAGNSVDLFSFDGIYETLGEFGVTISSVVLCMDYIPDKIPFQYGLSYLYATIYILPIGWLVSIPNASIGHTVTSMAGIPVGSSYLLDLYANFGWFSPIPAFVLGVFLTKIITPKFNPVNIAINCFLTYILINYVRASTSEILRPTFYILFLFWYLANNHMKALKKR